MTVRVTREAEPQIEIYGAYSGELLGTGNGVRATLTFTPTDKYLILVIKGSMDKVQLEAGAFPTSYIPTTGATATRAADICSIATSAFGYNQGAGTVVVDVADAQFGTSGYPRAVELGNSSSGVDRINMFVASASGTYSAGLYTANVFQIGGTLVSSISNPFVPRKAALAYKTNDGAAAYNGAIKITDATIDVSGTTYPRNTLKIGGSTTSATDQINGHIKSIRYFPRRLTNAQLQALTA